MPQNYWINIRIRVIPPPIYVRDGLNSVFDPTKTLLKFYVDESPENKEDLSREGTGRRVNVNSPGMYLSNAPNSAQGINCFFRVTPKAYENRDRNIYVWVETPIGHYALKGRDVHGGRYVGRVKLPYTAKLTSGVISDRLLNHPAEWLPSYVQRGDFFTTYQLYLGPSVLNYIACEINVNTRSDFTKKWQNPQTENPMIGYVTPGGDGDPNSFGQGDVSLISPSINMDVVNDTSVTVTEEDLELVRKAHTNSGGLGWTYRRGFNLLGRDGGGEWDHKPKIEPHYGNYIRTGNSGNLYYYDYFSNIHFGYIAHAMGMSTERSLLGTNIFQQVDNAGASEDYYDKSPNLAGWRLAARKRANSTYPGNMVTSYDIYQELLSHPRWESMSRPGVRRIAGQQKQDWHLFE